MNTKAEGNDSFSKTKIRVAGVHVRTYLGPICKPGVVSNISKLYLLLFFQMFEYVLVSTMRCKQQTCYVVRCPGLYQKNVMFLHRTLFPELFRTSHGFPSVPASTYLSPGLSLTFWEARRVTTTWAARTTLQPASRCQTRSDNSWRKKKVTRQTKEELQGPFGMKL